MTILNETIQLDRPVHEVFAYVADFSTCQEWDSTALISDPLDDQPLGVGSRFRVVCDLPIPIATLPLEYEITEYVPDEKVVLIGRGRFFDVEDTITFQAINNGKGCEVDYTAEFTWKGAARRLAGSFESGLKRMGVASVQKGMKRALQNNFPAPAISASNKRADKFVPLAMSRFTRRGYRLGKKRWNPVSAYMGDKHVVITGATAGLGKASAQYLARKGAELTLVVRDKARGQQLVKDLAASTGNERIHLEIADLSLMSDVESALANLNSRGQAIDVLINNAGALFNPRQETAEGLEQSFALLLLAPYRLTEGLKPLLDKATEVHGEARVINVVSGGMYTQRLDLKDLQNERGKYSGSVAYAKAKRALMIKTEQWAEDWAEDNIVVNAMHPGWADTPGVQSALPEFRKITRRVLRSSEEGADTINYLAIATEAGQVSGKLFLDREPRRTHLMQSTRETAEEREQLRQILIDWDKNWANIRSAA